MQRSALLNPPSFQGSTVVFYDPLYFCGISCNLFLLRIYLLQPLLLFFSLVSLAKGLSVSFFQNTSSSFHCSFLFTLLCISIISIVIFVISSHLSTLGLILLFLVPWGIKLGPLIFLFLNVGTYHYELPCQNCFGTSHAFWLLYSHFHVFRDAFPLFFDPLIGWLVNSMGCFFWPPSSPYRGPQPHI